MPKKPASEKQIESFVHDDASRRNIPPAEFQTMVRNQEKTPIQVAYERRNPDLDPQLIWRGKDLLDESQLVVNTPPLYIQEKIHPKVLIDDLRRRSKEGSSSQTDFIEQMGLFDTIKGDVGEGAKTEFYQHDQNWTNRMILGDSLQVMASLAEREGLRGKVQCIYFDPPYGIKFNSNFQWSISSRDVRDGKSGHITREPEQVKAFRDTWRDGIHSYLGYIRDRLVLFRDLLADSGSVFVQIGEDNVYLLRSLLAEVFGQDNDCTLITFKKTSGAGSFAGGTTLMAAVSDYIIWFAKDKTKCKYRQPYLAKEIGGLGAEAYTQIEDRFGGRRRASIQEIESGIGDGRFFRPSPLTSETVREGQTTVFPVSIDNRSVLPSKGGWKTNQIGMSRLQKANRVILQGKSAAYVRYHDDFTAFPLTNLWNDTQSGSGMNKIYVVQTREALSNKPV